MKKYTVYLSIVIVLGMMIGSCTDSTGSKDITQVLYDPEPSTGPSQTVIPTATHQVSPSINPTLYY